MTCCRFAAYHSPENMFTVRYFSEDPFSVCIFCHWTIFQAVCLCKSVLADTFKISVHLVQTGAEPHVCQHQGIHLHWAEASPMAPVPTNKPHDSIISTLAPGVLNVQLHLLALSEPRVGWDDPLTLMKQKASWVFLSGLAPQRSSSSWEAVCEFLQLLSYKKRLLVS